MQSFRSLPEAVGERPFLHMCRHEHLSSAERRGWSSSPRGRKAKAREEASKAFCLGEDNGLGSSDFKWSLDCVLTGASVYFGLFL